MPPFWVKYIVLIALAPMVLIVVIYIIFHEIAVRRKYKKFVVPQENIGQEPYGFIHLQSKFQLIKFSTALIVLINGQEAGIVTSRRPFTQRIRPGNYTIQVERHGFYSPKLMIQAQPEQTVVVEVGCTLSTLDHISPIPVALKMGSEDYYFIKQIKVP